MEPTSANADTARAAGDERDDFERQRQEWRDRRTRDGRKSSTDRGPIAEVMGWADLRADFPLTDDPAFPALLRAPWMVLGVRVAFSAALTARARFEMLGGVVSSGAPAAAEFRLAETALRFAPVPSLWFELGAIAVPLTESNRDRSPIRAGRHVVELPGLDRAILPQGFVTYGLLMGVAVDFFTFELGLFPGVDARKFTAAGGIGPGLPTTASASIENMMIVTRISLGSMARGDCFVVGLAAFYAGTVPSVGIPIPEVDVVGFAGDVRWHPDGLGVPDLSVALGVAWLILDGVNNLNTVLGTGMGEQLFGAWITVAYDLMTIFLRGTNLALFAYARFDYADTHFHVPNNTARDLALQQWSLTFGLALRLTPGTRITLEVEDQHDRTPTDPPDRFTLGVAFEY